MPSLDELKQNAIPPTEINPNLIQNANGTATYVPHKATAARPVEVDPKTLGEAAPPPPPTILDNMMDDLDKAIIRDRQDMWKNVIAPAKEAMENNEAFGVGGDDNYFNGEIGSTQSEQTKTAETITITPEQREAVGMASPESIPTPVQEEDDFLSDNDIYKGDVSEMETKTSQYYVPNTNATTAVNQDTVVPKVTTVYESNNNTNQVVDSRTVASNKVTAEEVHIEQVKSVEGSMASVDVSADKYYDNIIKEAFGDEDDEDAVVDDADIEAMKDIVKKDIKPVNNVVDLRSFKISNRPITAGRVMNEISSTALPTAKWVLPATGTSIIMSALKGVEIDLLGNRRQGQTELMRNQEIIQTFYNHIVGDKPGSWEAWAKSVIFDDFSHLYFAEYLACFSNANFAPFECDKCNHSFMQRVELMDMVKYKDDESKAKVNALLNTDPKTGAMDAEYRQVSDKFVIAFRKPTIWNTMFEDLYLPEKVRNEMGNIVGIFNHIAEIYLIDRDTNELRPIDTKPVAGDMAKTLKNKFKIYYDILRSLTSDQLTAISPIIVGLHKDADLMTYQYPEVKCPKCGETIPAREEGPLNILFLRHQLQSILVS